MHVLPDLEALEQMFSVEDGVAVIGVHSAKFENEKDSANILSAVLRYGIHHPVVNDIEAKLWNKLKIVCWPTLVVVGPTGQFLYVMVGEGHRQRLLDFIKVTLNYYKEKGEINYDSLPLELAQLPPSPLRFPGKVCVSKDGRTLVVADTGHHRILVMDKNGVVKHVIGCSERGYKDGSFQEAMFSSPQGVAISDTSVFVADTENHMIRKVDLLSHTVSTIAGTGIHGEDKIGGNCGTEQEISSPWDLVIGDSLGGQKDTVLYIAMAGTHQIWAYFLQDSTWYKNKHCTAGTCMRFAGSGLEENKNNSYPDKAGFAQPSGLVLSRALNCLFVADSESSSIRLISLKDGAVKKFAGGDIDPKNLFAFGDLDGVGTKAKLQHPLGVGLLQDEGPVLIADSYNHKIKVADVKTKDCRTLIETGKLGTNKGDNWSEFELSEPGGLCVDQKNRLVYIADTNNHRIVVVDTDSQKCSNLPIIFAEGCSDTDTKHFDDTDHSGTELDRSMAATINIKLKVQCAKGVHLNEEAPNSWKLTTEDEKFKAVLESQKLKGNLSQDAEQTLTQLSLGEITLDTAKVTVTFDLFVCEDEGVCRMEKKTITQELKFKPPEDLLLTLDVE